MRILIVCILVIGCLVPRTGWADSPPTNGEIGSALLRDLLDPVRSRVPAEAESSLALRNLAPPAGGEGTDAIEDAVAAYFFDRGYEVWILEPEASGSGESLLFEFQLESASFSYPRVRTSWLGLGSEKLARHAEASMTAKLLEADSGRLIWRGSPEARHDDWIESEEQGELAGDHPAWAEQDGIPPPGSSSPWKERVAVLGLLGGVVLLYFAGAN